MTRPLNDDNRATYDSLVARLSEKEREIEGLRRERRGLVKALIESHAGKHGAYFGNPSGCRAGYCASVAHLRDRDDGYNDDPLEPVPAQGQNR
jgi:hypothetical protein